MSDQLDLWGGAVPAGAVDWPVALQELARRELSDGVRLSADEAGALIHALEGKHDAGERCRYDGRVGAEALRRLRRREGEPGRQTRSPRLADNRPGSPARARRDDPGTSKAAARSISPAALRASQDAIVRVLRELGPMDDSLLVDSYQAAVDDGLRPVQSPSGIRTRRAELTAAGIVRDTGRKTRLESGRDAIVWELVTERARKEYDPEPEL